MGLLQVVRQKDKVAKLKENKNALEAATVEVCVAAEFRVPMAARACLKAVKDVRYVVTTL